MRPLFPHLHSDVNYTAVHKSIMMNSHVVRLAGYGYVQILKKLKMKVERNGSKEE